MTVAIHNLKLSNDFVDTRLLPYCVPLVCNAVRIHAAIETIKAINQQGPLSEEQRDALNLDLMKWSVGATLTFFTSMVNPIFFLINLVTLVAALAFTLYAEVKNHYATEGNPSFNGPGHSLVSS